jgi:hypothetical protein
LLRQQVSSACAAVDLVMLIALEKSSEWKTETTFYAAFVVERHRFALVLRDLQYRGKFFAASCSIKASKCTFNSFQKKIIHFVHLQF